MIQRLVSPASGRDKAGDREYISEPNHVEGVVFADEGRRRPPVFSEFEAAAR